MTDSARFTTRRVQDALVIELPEQAGIGSLELVNEMPRALSAPKAEGVRHVLVDCTKLRFAGSVFLESLIQLHRRLEEQDGQMVLCGVHDELAEILHLAKFDTLWERFESVDDALRGLSD